MSISFLEPSEAAAMVSDVAPETEDDGVSSPDGLYCVVCGKPLTYGGRGPKPKYCDEHKKNKPTSSTPRTLGTTNQAKTAAALLARLNSLIGVGLALYGLPMTAGSIAEANEQFQAIAEEALTADPKLAKKILSAGGSGGKAGLAMAYGVFAVSIVPTALAELKVKKDAQQATDVS